jgi:hypothetical protein
MASDAISYEKRDLMAIVKVLKAMDDEATNQAKQESGAIAEFAQGKIKERADGRGAVASRIADGSRVSKSSKIGEISFGFAAQKFSGGGTTQMLWGGSEFGSNRFKQFPVWSGREGRGSRGWFIYPTLRAEQPYLLSQWEMTFANIVKEW